MSAELLALAAILPEPGTETDRSLPCRREDPDTWFSTNPVVQDRAATLCQECPAVDACLEEALRWEGGAGGRVRYGIWGGMTPQARASLARSRGRHR